MLLDIIHLVLSLSKTHKVLETRCVLKYKQNGVIDNNRMDNVQKLFFLWGGT
jgi:hypothetical protein